MSEQFYLKPNVVVESLVHHWYAWSHLIAPSTAARNFTDRHLPIIESFIKSPAAHAAAVKNPKLLGGPFMDLGPERLDDIKRLVELSRAFCELDGMLRGNATGYSLEPLYEKVPEGLRVM